MVWPNYGYAAYSINSDRSQTLRHYKEIEGLKDSRKEYLREARDIRIKLQFLEKWEKENKA